MMVKRLFVFAGYDKDGIVDNTLLHYLNALSSLGDIVFYMDNDADETEIKKITSIKNVVYAEAKKHGEYDFGSYKRGYLYSKEHKLLSKYDWVYFVNDSVYGPLWDLKPILTELETSKEDLIGMTSYESKENPIHIQSWFVGLSKKLISEDFIDKFFTSITHQPNKSLIILRYEVGLSRLCINNGYKICVVYNTGKVISEIYRCPVDILKKNVPFIKKDALSQFGHLDFLYQFFVEDNFIQAIKEYVTRTNKNMSDVLMPYYDVYPAYKPIYKVRLFGVPLLKITYNTKGSYKVFLFGFIKIIKIITEKRSKEEL